MDTSAQPPNTSNAYPDRGLKAYSVVFGAWLTLFPASGLLNSTGILQAWLFEHQLQGYSESVVAWIFSTFAFLFFFGGLGVGMLDLNKSNRVELTDSIGPVFDKYGLRGLVPVGAGGLCVALVATSFCTCMYPSPPGSFKLTYNQRSLLPIHPRLWLLRRRIVLYIMDNKHCHSWTLV
jgi:hypothetical protein